MDNINVIEPSYGSPTDGTGSLVSNRIKFKELSRKKIQNYMAKKLKEISEEELKEKQEKIESKAQEVASDVVNIAATTPKEEFSEEVVNEIKEKSEYAKLLESRIEALEAKDIDQYIATLKPIGHYDGKSIRKPIKLKPTNFPVTYVNGRKFSDMIKKEEEKVESFAKDITEEKFETPVEENETVNVEQVAVNNEQNLVENINNAMDEKKEETVEGFVPAISDMQAVGENLPQENVVEKITPSEEKNVEEITPSEEKNVEEIAPSEEKNVEEIAPSEEKNVEEDNSNRELTEEDIRNEIDRIMAKVDVNKEDASVDLINNLENVDGDKEEVREVVTTDIDDLGNEEMLEEPIRELPIVAPEREMESEMVEKDELQEDENLHYDYSSVTENDIDNINDIDSLAEMRKALSERKEALEEAKAKRNQTNSTLQMTQEEVENMQKVADDAKKEKSETRRELKEYIERYDNDIAAVNKDIEEANSKIEKTNQEIENYKASIASDTAETLEMKRMMGLEEVADDDNQKRM